MANFVGGKDLKQASSRPGDKKMGGLKKALAAALPEKLRVSIVRGLGNIAAFIAPTEARKSAILNATFHQSRSSAYQAYRIFNRNYPLAEQEFHEDLIGRAVDFGYLEWPRKIQQYVQSKDVLDVGCGTGIHSIGSPSSA